MSASPHAGPLPDGPALFAPRLTVRQRAALSHAVRSGYYEIPRPINLHTLAGQMGISAASMSELLRRAEREVLVAYATTLMA